MHNAAIFIQLFPDAFVKYFSWTGDIMQIHDIKQKMQRKARSTILLEIGKRGKNHY